MVGTQGLIKGVTRGGSIVGDGIGDGVMMIVRVGRPGHAQQQRRGGAVEGLLHPGSSVVCLVILTHHRLGTPIRGLVVGGVLRGGGGVCRVFVNVCEVREWSGPGVAA